MHTLHLRIATCPKVTLDHILVKTYPIFIQFEDYTLYYSCEGYCNLGKLANLHNCCHGNSDLYGYGCMSTWKFFIVNCTI